MSKLSGAEKNAEIVAKVLEVLELPPTTVQRCHAQRSNYSTTFYGDVALKSHDPDYEVTTFNKRTKMVERDILGLKIDSCERGLDPGFFHVCWTWYDPAEEK